jgi:hypothetical protein
MYKVGDLCWEVSYIRRGGEGVSTGREGAPTGRVCYRCTSIYEISCNRKYITVIFYKLIKH